MSPSTTPDRRARWPGWDMQAITVLESAGYKPTPDWKWIPPKGHTPTERELDAIEYLIEEFDWGGLVRAYCTRKRWRQEGPDCAGTEECGGLIEDGACSRCGGAT